MSRDIKYIGMDVHKEAIVIAVLDGGGKLVMESIVETKASSILQFIHGLRGELHVTWEEGTWAAWLYDLLQPQVTQVLQHVQLLIESLRSSPHSGFADLGQPLSSMPTIVDVPSCTGNRPAAVHRFQPVHDSRQVFDDG